MMIRYGSLFCFDNRNGSQSQIRACSYLSCCVIAAAEFRTRAVIASEEVQTQTWNGSHLLLVAINNINIKNIIIDCKTKTTTTTATREVQTETWNGSHILLFRFGLSPTMTSKTSTLTKLKYHHHYQNKNINNNQQGNTNSEVYFSLGSSFHQQQQHKQHQRQNWN